MSLRNGRNMPRRGEVWSHKSSAILVEIRYVEKVGSQYQVQWWSKHAGTHGKDTLDSFLERFEKVPDLMANLEESLKR